MKKSNSQSLVLGLVLVLSLINVSLLVIGIQWVHEVMSELSDSSEDGLVPGAGEKIDQAHASAVNALRLVAWSVGLPSGLVLLAITIKHWRRATRAEEAAKLRSYSRNLARGGRDGRREEKNAPSSLRVVK